MNVETRRLLCHLVLSLFLVACGISGCTRSDGVSGTAKIDVAPGTGDGSGGNSGVPSPTPTSGDNGGSGNAVPPPPPAVTPTPTPAPTAKPTPTPTPTPMAYKGHPDHGDDGGSCGSGKGDENDDDEADDDGLSDDDLARCAALTGVDVQKIVSGDGQPNQITVQSDQAAAFKISGDQPSVHITVRPAGDGNPLKGLCIFASGNQPTVQVEITSTVQVVSYIGRGNQSSASFTITDPGAITGAFQADLAGNGASLSVSGTGSFTCPAVTTHGHNPTVTCSK